MPRQTKATTRSLRVHLLALAFVLLVPALLAGGATAWQLGRSQRRSAEAGLLYGARALATAVDRELEVAVTAAASLAGSRVMRTLAQTGELPALDPADEALADLYARARAVGEAFGGWMVLARRDGVQLLNTLRPLGAELPSVNGLGWGERAAVSGRPVVSDLFIGNVSQRPTLAVFAPVLPLPDPPGAAAGPSRVVLILAFDPVRLAQLLAEVGEEGTADLIEAGDGRIIARSVGHGRAVGRMAPAWITTPLREQPSGLARGALLEGPRVIAAFQRLQRVPWSVVVTAPLAAHEAAWRAPLWRLGLGAAALLSIAILLVMVTARRLLRPVDALVREGKAVAAGSAVPPVAPPARVTEFEALRLALRSAAEAIRARATSEGRAEAAEAAARDLAAGEARMRETLATLDLGAFLTREPGGAIRFWSKGCEALFGWTAAEAVGRPAHVLLRTVFPVPQAEIEATLERAGEWNGDLWQRRRDGTELVVAVRKVLRRDQSGRPLAVLESLVDVTSHRRAEEARVLLVREVDHRAKNALAVALSLVRLAPRDDAAAFAKGVEGRIAAMARAHTLLAREKWSGVDLRILAEGELAPHLGRVRLMGPPARLAAEAAQPVAMLLHELATNAAKHGALSRPDGVVELSWGFGGGEGGLCLRWSERGGPVITGAPARCGFGSRLLASLAERQLSGHLGFEWRREGLHVVLDLPPRHAAPSDASTYRGERSVPLSATPTTPMPAAARPPRVLLVEDDALVAMEIEAALRELGCTVVGPARDLAEAVRLARSAPDLHAAVLDVNLGGGERVFPAADLLATRGVPVLFSTGYGSAEVLQGRDATAVAVLRKPYPREALASALREALRRRAEAGAD